MCVPIPVSLSLISTRTVWWPAGHLPGPSYALHSAEQSISHISCACAAACLSLSIADARRRQRRGDYSQGVGARFFINFCNLPQRAIFGRLVYGDGSEVEVSVESYPLCMIALLSISYYFTISGGQIAVVVTDFAQGLFTTFTFIAICFYLVGPVFDWSDAEVTRFICTFLGTGSRPPPLVAFCCAVVSLGCLTVVSAR